MTRLNVPDARPVVRVEIIKHRGEDFIQVTQLRRWPAQRSEAVPTGDAIRLPIAFGPELREALERAERISRQLDKAAA